MPLSGQELQEKHHAKGISSIQKVQILSMPNPHPAHLQRCCPWLLTGHLPPDLYHARFSQDPHMGHGQLQKAVSTGKHQCCAVLILIELKSWGVEEDLIQILVFVNVSVKVWIIHPYECSFFCSSSEVLLFPSN